MKKASIIAIVSIGISAIAGGVFSLCSLNASADDPTKDVMYYSENDNNEILSSLKIGKYHKIDGKEDEYIEVFEDGTIQMFGYDYMATIKQINGEDYIDSLPDESIAELEDIGKYIVSRHKYTLNEVIPFIHFSDDYDSDETGKSGLGFTYDGADTIIYDKSLGMIYEYDGADKSIAG